MGHMETKCGLVAESILQTIILTAWTASFVKGKQGIMAPKAHLNLLEPELQRPVKMSACPEISESFSEMLT